MVFGVGVGEVGFGFLEFSLTEFDDGAEAEVVAGLREVETEAGLFAELLGDGEAFEGAVSVLPGIANVASNVVAKVGKLLAIEFGLKIGGFGAGAVERAVENGDVDIHADGAVPVGDVIIANGSFTDDAESVDGGAPEVMFGAAKSFRGLDLVLKRGNFRTLLECLLNQREDIQSGRGDRGGLFDKLEVLFVRKAQDLR